MGITIGALVVRKLSKAAELLTPRGMAGGLAGSLGDLADALREFGADVRAAMSEREAELRVQTGIDGPAGAHREN
jgi:chromosome condensin MukBEF MukE localization factor